MPHTRSTDFALITTVSFLFFLSGFIGLGYEVVWFKKFSQLWGNSTLAMAAVVASFLLGLGLGAYLLGRLADRVERPLAWYGLCEIGVALGALSIPLQIGWLFELYPIIQAPLNEYYPAQSLLKLILTFAVLGPTCALMGGTLPLILKQFAPVASRIKHHSGWLYSINTLGATLGCYAAGFHLLPWLGLNRLNLIFVGASLLVGVAALLVDRRLLRPVAIPSTDLDSAGGSSLEKEAIQASSLGRNLPFWSVLLAAFLAGFGSLVLQVSWTRQLVLILGGSTYAFTAMLTVFLLGIGLGSLVFHLQLTRLQRLERVAPVVILALILATLLGKWSVSTLTLAAGGLREFRDSLVFNGLFSLGASATLELLPTMAMGALFPLLLHLAAMRSTKTGRAVGDVYGLNIAGSIVGAAAAAILIIPTLGVSNSVAIALVAYMLALSLLFPSLDSLTDFVQLFALLVVASGATLLATEDTDPRLTNLGMYLYGIPAEEMILDTKVLFFEEGSTSNVLVTENDGVRSLRVNGKVDASDGLDMSTQIGLAYFPLFHRPDAAEVLVIGLGSGTTSGAALQAPQASVTCCELEPAVDEASHYFSKVNHTPHDESRFSIVFEDGRSFLQGTSKTFDLIISEPSNPWISGVSNLFTKEFYRLVADKLNDRGILAQWIQTYSFSPGDYALAVRTLMDVFPEVRLIRITDGDTVLLASLDSLAFTGQSLDRAQRWVDSSPEVEADLKKFLGTDDVRRLLFRHMLMDSIGLRHMIERTPVGERLHTDQNMRLEFDSPLRLFGQARDPEAVANHILSAVDWKWFQSLAAELKLTGEYAASFHHLVSLLDGKTDPESIRRIIELGLALDSEDPSLLADELIWAENIDLPDFIGKVEFLVGASESDASRLSKALWAQGAHEKAVEVLERLVLRIPESVTAWTNLAISYEALGRIDLAEESFERALFLDPLNSFAVASHREFLENQRSSEDHESATD